MQEILEEFYTFRLGWYESRKAAMMLALNAELSKLDNRARFILMVVNEQLKINKVSKSILLTDLWRHKFALLAHGRKTISKEQESEQEQEVGDLDMEMNVEEKIEIRGQAVPAESKLRAGYEYLLSMPLWSLTLEKVNELKRQAEEKRSELETLRSTTATSMWNVDLTALEKILVETEEFEKKERENEVAAKQNPKGLQKGLQKGKAKTVGVKRKGNAEKTKSPSTAKKQKTVKSPPLPHKVQT